MSPFFFYMLSSCLKIMFHLKVNVHIAGIESARITFSGLGDIKASY